MEVTGRHHTPAA